MTVPGAIVEEPLYDHELLVHYTASIIEHMGGRGPNVVPAAREIYDQWATNHHFEMYDYVEPVLRLLVERGYTIGAISNSHRSLDAFFDLLPGAAEEDIEAFGD